MDNKDHNLALFMVLAACVSTIVLCAEGTCCYVFISRGDVAAFLLALALPWLYLMYIDVLGRALVIR